MIKLTWRIWALVILLALSILSIFSFPPLFFSKGVIVKSVEVNSTAFNEGLKQGEIIKSINNQPINNFDEYSNIVSPLNNKTNESIKWVITTNKNTYSFFNQGSLQIVVSNIPKTTLKTGLDLQGGARALVSPEKQLTTNEMQDLIAVSNERLNVYGISDVVIKQVSDLTGNNYMLVEIAGATPKDLESLIGQQGKFEAKIGNETVFVGGNKDITYVARTGQEAGILPCAKNREEYSCGFVFSISLSEEAAQRHADITSDLNSDPTNPGYLDQKLDLYLDGQLTDSLSISTNLKGSATTQISISG